MSYQQILDKAIGESPPSTIDVDAVVHRQRRLIHRHRITAVAAGVLVVALGVGAVANWPLLPSNRSSEPAAPTTAAPHVPPVPIWVTFKGVAPTEPPTMANVRLSDVFRRAVAESVPNGTVTGLGGDDPFEVQFTFVPEDPSKPDSSGYQPMYEFQGVAVVRSASGAGLVTIRIARFTNWEMSCDLWCIDRTRLPDGGEISGYQDQLARGDGSNGADDIPMLNVWYDRTDGTFIWIVAHNQAGIEWKPDGHPLAPAPPVTIDQMKQIAMFPGMTLYP